MKILFGVIFLIGAFLFVQHDDFIAEQKANEHLKESIALAKKDKAEHDRKFKRLYLEAQEKTGFPVVQR